MGKKQQGDEGKKARRKAAAKLAELKGIDVNKMTTKQKEDLLIVILQLFGLADEKGMIK